MKKIAIPVNQNNQIEDHFGHCDFYEIYTIAEDNKVVDIKTIASDQGCGCKSDIASVLAENGVTIMLAGGIGQGAINVLNSSNIQVVTGCSGNAQEVVKQFVDGKILTSGEICSHHDADHQCSH